MSYEVDNFDELVKLFADPNTRTRRNLRPLYCRTVQSMVEVQKRANELFESTPEYEFGGPGIEQAYRSDMQGLLDRSLVLYSELLVPPGVEPCDLDQWGDLDPDALAPQAWRGLVRRRKVIDPDGLGAGPVADAAMPAHLAERIGMLEDHVDALGGPWWRGTIRIVGDSIRETVEDVTDVVSDAASTALIAIGGAVLIGLFGYGAYQLSRSDDER